MSNYTRSIIYLSEGDADGAATGATLITQTRDSGEYNFQPFRVQVRIMQAQNVLTPAVVSVGTNDPDYNNIVSAKSVGGVLGCINLLTETNVLAVAGETDMKVKVNTAAIPVPLTTATLDFRIIIEGVEA